MPKAEGTPRCIASAKAMGGENVVGRAWQDDSVGVVVADSPTASKPRFCPLIEAITPK